MAPEQALGEPLSAATDAWGIGVVLYKATTGIPPFEADDDGTWYGQLEGRADPVRTHRCVPRAFAAAIDGCLEPDPAGRPTVAELADALAALL